MFLLSKVKRVGKIKKSLKNLKSKEYIILSDGFLAEKNNKSEIVYREIKFIIMRNKLNQISDDELIIMLNEIDELLLFNNIEKEKIQFLKKAALKIKMAILNRINRSIKIGIKLINQSNKLIEQNKLEDIPYFKISLVRSKIEYYLETISQNSKLQEVFAELGFILSKNVVSKKEVKKYEKTRLSI